MMALSAVIADILGMDHIDTKILPDRIVYVYKGSGISSRKKIIELKAKIQSIVDFPADIPFDIRITPVKKGLLIKEYLIEVHVKRTPFELK